MVALCNRADHYIFALWFLLLSFFFLLFFFLPNLSRRRLDVYRYHTSIHGVALVMVALCNRADHYIFMLWFILLSFFFLLFFPRLISAVGDWMFTILWHMLWP